MINARRFLALSIVLMLYAAQASSEAAFGQHGDYRQAWPSIDFESEHEVWVTVVDERPYVRSRNKSATFTGLSRSQVGIPYDIATTSGNVLAEDVQSAVVNGFMNSGIYAQVGQPPNSRSSAEKKSMELHLRLTLYEWKSDTYKNTSFQYDLVAEVVGGPSGPVEARMSGKNEDTSGVDAARKALSKLLNDPNIQNAFDSSFVPPPPTPAPAPVPSSSTTAPEPSGAYDDLIKLKDLHDKAVITEEEFDAKKTEILKRY